MMPEPLTEAQLAELHQDLIQLKSELELLLGQAAQSAKTVELDQATVGRLSRMDAIQGQAMAASAQRRTAIRLQQVVAALIRIEEGEYGECVHSGNPIGYGRLKARPEAPFCLEA